MTYDPLADLQRLGVPCDQFERKIVKVLQTLSRSEAEAFASIWHKANTGGLNSPMQPANEPDVRMVGWIFGKIGY
jgi:hypothetical protein